jgi:hypothetical protein
VFVRVRNRSCMPAVAKPISLYWAKASTNLGWPSPWNGSEKAPGSGAPMGGKINTFARNTGPVMPGQSTVLEFLWEPPNPADFASFGGDRSHFCLLATIEDPAPPATAPSLVDLVRLNNNIGWKNVSVATDAQPQMAVTVGGNSGGPQRLLFEEHETPSTPARLFDWGTMVVDLGPGLFAAWEAGGRQSQNIDLENIVGTRIPLLQSGASLGNLQLGPSDRFTLKVDFISNSDPALPNQMGVDVYSFGVTQLVESTQKVVGGQRFVLKTQRPAPDLPASP